VVVSSTTHGEINNTQAKMLFGSKKGKAWNGLGSSLRFRSGWNGHHGAEKKVPNNVKSEADPLLYFFFSNVKFQNCRQEIDGHFSLERKIIIWALW